MIRRGRELRLTARLKALADLVTEGNALADVGCDHGFLDIYLVLSGKAPRAYAMDVREGPLAAAAQHVAEYGLEDRIRMVLSDGLAAYEKGWAQSLVCAGMGGPLMQRILTAYPEKTDSFEELILQPQSELREFRKYLRENGYKILEERILFDEGKYYFPMRVCRRNGKEDGASDRDGNSESEGGGIPGDLRDRFGGLLLLERSPLLRQYLLWQQSLCEKIWKELKAQNGHLERRAEIEEELDALQRALRILNEA